MIRLGQTWIHRVDGTHVIVLGVDDVEIEAIVFVGGNDWMRARFDRHAFVELYQWQP